MKKEWRDAALSGDRERLEKLLADGGDVDVRDKFGQTALMLAARHGHTAAAQFLIGAGADLDVTAKYGLSATMLAVINRHDAIARALANAGADLTLQGTGAPGFSGKTAADLASDNGQAALAETLRLGGTGGA